jgi:hypothetical protein
MFESEAHYHTPDGMPCLEETPEVPTGEWTQVDGQARQVTLRLPNWWHCTYLNLYLHLHGQKFHAHTPREKCAFA